ncbi:MAG: nitrilase-related carbon-nitrogen hydrolase [Pseudomonadota bacterium]|nr:nitrilase-related carbon-nitrogen hydrolase [Pseudomonadota bacterium]
MSQLTIAIAQLRPEGTDKAKMLAKAERFMEQAALVGSDLFLLPECWAGTALGEENGHQELAEAIPGELTHWLSEKAKTYGLMIAGSFYEQCADHIHNSLPLIDKQGKILGVYRKIHLFDAPDREDLGQRFAESDRITPGNDIVVCDTEFGKIGLSICMDLRFPELYRAQAQRGAHILINCAAWLAPGTFHWQNLLQARAIENQCYVLGCGYYGLNQRSNTEFAGKSCIISPWGERLTEADDKECLLTHSVDLGCVERLRRRFPVLEMRRSALF